MWDAGPQQLGDWVAAHWQVALWLAGAQFFLTSLGIALLTESGQKSVSNWMKGTQTHETWAQNFTALFDAIFGQRHRTWRCVFTSSVVSLTTVIALWVIIGTQAGLGLRLTSLEALWQVVALGIAVNILADYISLLQTRWFLGLLSRRKPVWLQVLVLLGDLVITAAIIWAVLWAVQALSITSFILGDERDGWAEIVGLFSPLAVFFYSTFITSIWTWGFILSSWLMRCLASRRILHGVYTEHPRKMLSAALAGSALVVGFFGSVAYGALTAPNAQNLSPLDRTLCWLSPGKVCLDVRRLTEDEATRLTLTLYACRGGITEECLRRGLDTYEQNGALAAQYWRAACESDDASSCTNLGVLQEKGIGLETDLAAAARLYRQGCDGGDALGCTNLGVLHNNGIGMEVDSAAAVRLYRQGCDGGNALGCTYLAILYENGIGVEADPAAAARLYRQGCDGGDARGCTNLGILQNARSEDKGNKGRDREL